MTLQEFIDILNKVEDKSIEVEEIVIVENGAINNKRYMELGVDNVNKHKPKGFSL